MFSCAYLGLPEFETPVWRPPACWLFACVSFLRLVLRTRRHADHQQETVVNGGVVTTAVSSCKVGCLQVVLAADFVQWHDETHSLTRSLQETTDISSNYSDEGCQYPREQVTLGAQLYPKVGVLNDFPCLEISRAFEILILFWCSRGPRLEC